MRPPKYPCTAPAAMPTTDEMPASAKPNKTEIRKYGKLTDSFQTSMTRFLGGRPRFRRNMLSKEKADREQEEPPTNVLILVEHPPVYTTGIRTKAGTHSYLSKIIIK